MNKINRLLSDSHVALNCIECLLSPEIQDLGLDDDFDVEYAKTCLYLISHSLVNVSALICNRLHGVEFENFEKEILCDLTDLDMTFICSTK